MVRGILAITVLYVVMAISSSGVAMDQVPVFVSVVPQKHFVRQIGKDRVKVEAMVRPGANPATYEPRPRQMADLASTRLYFAIGVPFEQSWLKRIAAANPGMKVIHTDAGIEKIAMDSHHHHDVAEAHHEKERHAAHGEHGGMDPHIWLSPALVIAQAKAILDGLVVVDPDHRSFYEANYNDFVSKATELDNELKQIFAGDGNRTFMVFHPSWGYFAHRYNLRQVAIEIEGKDPRPAQLKTLIEHARENGIRAIFVQPQFSQKSASLVAKAIGGQVVVADPLAENWPASLREVALKLKTALK